MHPLSAFLAVLLLAALTTPGAFAQRRLGPQPKADSSLRCSRVWGIRMTATSTCPDPAGVAEGSAFFGRARRNGLLWAAGAAQVGGSEIKMTAKKYEFAPNTITVRKGEHVKLVITALDHDHGFKLEAFKINERLKKGAPSTVEFTADQAGTFPFECSHFCGVGHGKMKGKLVIAE